MVARGVARGVVCWDSCMRSGGSGLARMDSESGGVWVATSCKVVGLAAAVGMG